MVFVRLVQSICIYGCYGLGVWQQQVRHHWPHSFRCPHFICGRFTPTFFFFRFCYLLLAVSVVESRCRYIACSFHSLQSAAEQRCTSKMPKKTMFVWRKNLIRSPPSSLPSLVHQQHLSVYLFLYISCRLFESPHRIASNMVSFWVHSCVVLSRVNENISRLRHAQTCTYPMCIHTTSIYIHTPVWWPISWQCKGNIHDFGARQRLRRTCFFFLFFFFSTEQTTVSFVEKRVAFSIIEVKKKRERSISRQLYKQLIPNRWLTSVNMSLPPMMSRLQYIFGCMFCWARNALKWYFLCHHDICSSNKCRTFVRKFIVDSEHYFKYLVWTKWIDRFSIRLFSPHRFRRSQSISMTFNITYSKLTPKWCTVIDLKQPSIHSHRMK